MADGWFVTETAERAEKKIWGMQSGGRRDRVIARDRNYPLLI